MTLASLRALHLEFQGAKSIATSATIDATGIRGRENVLRKIEAQEMWRALANDTRLHRTHARTTGTFAGLSRTPSLTRPSFATSNGLGSRSCCSARRTRRPPRGVEGRGDAAVRSSDRCPRLI